MGNTRLENSVLIQCYFLYLLQTSFKFPRRISLKQVSYSRFQILCQGTSCDWSLFLTGLSNCTCRPIKFSWNFPPSSDGNPDLRYPVCQYTGHSSTRRGVQYQFCLGVPTSCTSSLLAPSYPCSALCWANTAISTAVGPSQVVKWHKKIKGGRRRLYF